eukprot:TRINITY_DN505_c0_g1_i2.p1 TRINITY_DN505_c0_g1~~TRINITY_DN505_c0_g1_i2.p1  ORF type:complete len:339 (-),score=30.24 TRINITY_DN505_c0_g1_i2:17-1033(-)
MADKNPRYDPGAEHVTIKNEAPTESLTTKTVRITLVITAYFVISIALVFSNKFVMSDPKLNFPFPLLVSWLQLLIAMICIVIFGYLGKSIPMFSMFPPFEFNLQIAKKVLPLTVVYLLMISLNNVCLKYVHVTFYQVARALTTFFSIIFTKIILSQSTSYLAMTACAVVVMGFIVGSISEVNFNYEGLITGVFSSMFVSLYGIYVKNALPAVDGNHWRLLIYNTLLALGGLLPFVLFSGEIEQIRNMEPISNNTLMMILVSGLFGFAINIALFMQIRYTSPLTNSISGTVKACVQTILGYLIFKNEISPLNGFGILLVILGSAWYSMIRYKEMKQGTK